MGFQVTPFTFVFYSKKIPLFNYRIYLIPPLPHICIKIKLDKIFETGVISFIIIIIIRLTLFSTSFKPSLLIKINVFISYKNILDKYVNGNIGCFIKNSFINR